MNRMLKTIVIVLLVLAIIGALGLGFYMGRESTLRQLDQPKTLDSKLFLDAWRLIESQYLGRQELDRQKMTFGAISGMVKSLGDPYTTFMDPEEARQFERQARGRYVGLGVMLGIKKGKLTIITVFEGAPAERAGLRPGDKITKIDNTLTDGLTLSEVSKLLRGPKGAKVVLTIVRGQDSKEVEVVRGVIKTPMIKWELKEGNIAYIRINRFVGGVSGEFNRAAREILASNPKGIILDLRGNPGGLLGATIEIAGWFLENGEIVAIQDFGDGKKEEYRVYGRAKLRDFPLVVLINQGSASASELLAAALRDNQGVKLIGETSYGKGSVQQVRKLGRSSLIKITVARWLTPKGTSIMDEGLEPDIKIELTEEDFENDRDPQLEEAMKILGR